LNGLLGGGGGGGAKGEAKQRDGTREGGEGGRRKRNKILPEEHLLSKIAKEEKCRPRREGEKPRGVPPRQKQRRTLGGMYRLREASSRTRSYRKTPRGRAEGVSMFEGE